MDRTVPPGLVHFLLRDEQGATFLLAVGGARVPCTVAPSLPEAGEAEVTLTASGSTRPVVVAACPSVPNLYAACETTAAEDHLNTALATLVNQIAHDIRNYAFGIGLQTEMGLRQSPTPETRRHLEAVLRQLDNLKRYLEKLLLFGRPARITPQLLTLDTFLREEIQRFQFAWDPSSPPVTICLDTYELVGTVRWDPRAVSTIVAALLDNAARSATPPKPVTLGGRRENRTVVLEIRDEGPGMSEETLAQLAIPMKVRRPGAAGLGLAIVRKLVRAMGGEFSLRSGPEGTTATVVLPAEVTPV
jgi:signal transduction histidine kinase